MIQTILSRGSRLLYTLFFQTLPYLVLALVLFFLISFWRHKIKKKPLHLLHEGVLLLFLLWMVGVAMMTFVPAFSLSYVSSSGRLEFDCGFLFGILPEEVNLVPFRVFYDIKNALQETGSYKGLDYLMVNILFNLIMLAPMGFFLPLLWKKFSFPKVLLTGVGYTLLVELCQLPQKGRRTDIDDVWMNLIGLLAGYLVFLLLHKCIPAFVSKFQAQKE